MHLGYIELETVCVSLIWILRLFVNTLTADNKYSRCNVHNFAQQVQTRLSPKEETFSGFLIAFLKCAWNLENCEQKDDYPSLIISEMMDCERGGYLNVWKVFLQKTMR